MSNIHIATAIIYAFGAQPLALNHRTQYILDIIYVPLMCNKIFMNNYKFLQGRVGRRIMTCKNLQHFMFQFRLWPPFMTMITDFIERFVIEVLHVEKE